MRKKSAKHSVIVRYRDESTVEPCPYGAATRIITGGETEIANVHLIRVSGGGEHLHSGYNEVYYVLSGHGTLTVEGECFALCPGAVAVIPAGFRHAVSASAGEELEFIIFGSPGMSIDDERFIPRSGN